MISVIVIAVIGVNSVTTAAYGDDAVSVAMNTATNTNTTTCATAPAAITTLTAIITVAVVNAANIAIVTDTGFLELPSKNVK